MRMLPNESRLSCGAEFERSRMSGSLGRRQLQALVRQRLGNPLRRGADPVDGEGIRVGAAAARCASCNVLSPARDQAGSTLP